jgi:hypothetical protein
MKCRGIAALLPWSGLRFSIEPHRLQIECVDAFVDDEVLADVLAQVALVQIGLPRCEGIFILRPLVQTGQPLVVQQVQPGILLCAQRPAQVIGRTGQAYTRSQHVIPVQVDVEM